MSLIFLSHSSMDEIEAVALKQWLRDNGWDDVFLDLDPERGLKAGERWQEALRRAADRCEAVVFIISPAWAKSKWCLTEFLLAKSLHKLIFGVVLKEIGIGELPTELTAEYQLCYLIGEGSTETVRFTHREQPAEIAFLATGLKRLRLGLQSSGLSASFFPWPPDDKSRSPYRGLEPLEAQDAAVFFGRDAEILQGLDKLRGMRAARDQGLFVILGASGAGKSSFLRAGLLPRLARDDRHFYTFEPIRPERSPLFGERGLAQSLSQANQRLWLTQVNVGEVKTALNAGTEQLRALLRSIQDAARSQLLELPDDAPSPTLVLPVDQAEELFSADATQEARTFLAMIGEVLRASLAGEQDGSHLSLIVAFTIRSDRYEPLQTASELMGLKTVVFDALKPMPPVQFKEVITGPAIRTSLSVRRLEVKPDLVQQLLADCAQGADTLPLLGLTLARLYRDYSRGGDLRLDQYQSMGGMTDVIRTEVESVLVSDPDTRRAQMEALHAAFIPWLATINPQNDQSMRRVARMADLPPASQPLVQALIEKRLLLCDLRDGQPIVEVAHESLLRQWNALAEWLKEEREDLKEADRLEQAVAAWNRNGRKADWLMEGERLNNSESLAAKPGYHRRLDTASEYLLASRQRETQRKEDDERHRKAEVDAAQERQLAAETLAAEQTQAAQRLLQRKRQLQAAMAIVLILFGLTVYGFISSEMQRKNAETANRKAQSALAGAHFREAQRHYEDNNISYALVHLAHVVRLDPKWVAGSSFLVNLLQQRTWLLPQVSLMHEMEMQSAHFSPDGTRVVTASEDKTARLWDARTGKALGEVMRHQDYVWSAQFSPDGMRVVTASDDNTAQLWDAHTGKALGEAMRHQGGVSSAQFSPDGMRIATASSDKTAQLWDARTGKALGEAMTHQYSVQSIEFSLDGSRVVTVSTDNSGRLWDARTGKALGEIMKHQDRVVSAHFSPDGTRVVTASIDNTARLWDARTGKPLGETMTHQGYVWSAQFSTDGTQVVTASDDKTAQLWDARTGNPLGEAMTHQGPVRSAQFSTDGTRVATASEDKTARLWNARTGKPLGEAMTHQGPVRSAQFSTDGTQVVTASDDKTARLWNSRISKALSETMTHKGPVFSAQFSPDGMRVVTASGDNTARLWDARTSKPLGEAMTHESVVSFAQFSPDGTQVATASDDKTARLWDANTGKALSDAMTHQGGVSSVRFSPDGTQVATASDDKTRLWDARTGKTLGETMTHQGHVVSAQFSPDGTRVLTASMDNTARLWDVLAVVSDDRHLLADLAEAVAGKILSQLDAIESMGDQIGQLNMLREQTENAPLGRPTATSFIRWFLSDPWARTISPLSRLTIPEYIQQETATGRREQMEQEFPGHPLLRSGKMPILTQ